MATVAELQAVFDHLAEVQPPLVADLPPGTDTGDWIRAQRFAISRLMLTGQIVGLYGAGMPAWFAFAQSMRESDPRYIRGTRAEPFVKKLFDEIIDLKIGRAGHPIEEADLNTVIMNVSAWFEAEALPRKHVIPCSILTDRARTFTVGPVEFMDGAAFDAERFGVPTNLRSIALDPVNRSMQTREATWIAIVDADGYESDRSNEVAELAVDLGLAALQLFLPLNSFSRISRTTARTLPPRTAALVNVNGNVNARITNDHPGFGYSGPVFDEFIARGSAVLASAGGRIESFVTGAGQLPKLEMAWCNGAYWFHEALAEPLASVSIAKTETAIENLFGSSSLGQSKDRFRRALQGFYGKMPEGTISDSSTITIRAYVEKIVEVRSRILHGNWSTLTEELPLGRDEVADLARGLLARYTLAIDEYAQTANPTDEIGAFLDWVELRRLTRAAAAQPGPPP